MASQPMQGVRVVEVAQYTFVPAAGAVLAEWGAEVIKVEHAERGDAQRGLSPLGPCPLVARSLRSWSTPTTTSAVSGWLSMFPKASMSSTGSYGTPTCS